MAEASPSFISNDLPSPSSGDNQNNPPHASLRSTTLFLSCPRNELGAGGKESLPGAIAAPTMTTDEAQ